MNALEKLALQAFRTKTALPKNIEPTDENVLKVILQIALMAGEMIRESRFKPDRLNVSHKSDNSPVSNIDTIVEEMIKGSLKAVFPQWGFLGEETGGDLEQAITTVAVDPIDGTWSFLTHDTTSAFFFSVFQNKKVALGVVLNPSTGELGYAQNQETTRLIQLNMFGEDDLARILPSLYYPKENTLVNIQPASGHRELENALKDAWDKKELKFVKSMGGSPANALLEVAKGHFSYIHPWQIHPTTPYDIAAGIKLVENAGGKVVDTNGNRIHEVGHTGTFIASINLDHQEKILKILNGSQS